MDFRHFRLFSRFLLRRKALITHFSDDVKNKGSKKERTFRKDFSV